MLSTIRGGARPIFQVRGLASVNQIWRPAKRPVPRAHTISHENHSPSTDVDLKNHDRKEWTEAEVKDAAKDHCIMTWGATDPMLAGAMWPQKGEGVFFRDISGKRIIDFNSMAMCANLGHTTPPEVVSAVKDQLETMAFCYPGMGVMPIRARLSKLMAEMCPGDINSFLFPSTGMESNEVAVRMARIMTGRPKILSRYRSYHGGSTTTMAMTGDFRRVPAEPGAVGHVHMMDPYPYSFSWGASEEELCERNLEYVRELVEHEGPNSIAAIYLESVTGTNGILKPPQGYLEGIRALCDEHGILMVCDEVMAGFGRTGKLFGFQHADVLPDIFTGAKGLSSSYVPLGVVGMRDHVAEYFRSHPIGAGSTYNSHPVALACSYAVLKYMLKHKIIEHVQEMEGYMIKKHEELQAKHPSIRQARQIGLFGAFDLQKNSKGDFISQVFEPPTPAFLKFKKAVFDAGMFSMMRGHIVFTNPPLIIKPEEIDYGFNILDRCLPIMDEAMED